jgi:hypothetical protein
MGRGPLPPLPKETSGGIRGMLTMLDMIVRALPPPLKLPIARHVIAWGESVRDEATAQMGQPPPGANDFASHGATYETTGHGWPSR